MLRTLKVKASQSMYLRSSPNHKYLSSVHVVKRVFKPHLFAKVPVRIAVEWAILKKTVPKDLEKLVRNTQVIKLRQMT